MPLAFFISFSFSRMNNLVQNFRRNCYDNKGSRSVRADSKINKHNLCTSSMERQVIIKNSN